MDDLTARSYDDRAPHVTCGRQHGLVRLAVIACSALVLLGSGCAPGGTTASEAPVATRAPAPGLETADTPRVPRASTRPPIDTSSTTLVGPRTRTSGCVSVGGLPDAACTPGGVTQTVTQETIGVTICTPGYARRVRPPSSVTARIKHAVMAAYGLDDSAGADYELDHLVPLELGGAPDDIANLWPQPRTGEANSTMKDRVETALHDSVCRGEIPLADAQHRIATDWFGAYRTLTGSRSTS